MGWVRKVPRQKGAAYEAHYRDPAGKFRMDTFPTKREATAFLQGAETDMRRGEWVDPERGKLSFASYVEKWLPSTVHLRPTTRTRHDGILRVHLLPAFGPLGLVDIDEELIQGWVAAQLARGLAPGTVHKNFRLLAQILGTATRGRRPYIIGNPCASVNLPQIHEEEPISLEVGEVLALAQAFDRRYEAMILLAGFRGPRWGELAGLHRDRLDMKQGLIHIRGPRAILIEADGDFSFGPPKTKRGNRTIEIPPVIMPILDRHLLERPGEMVFTSPDGFLLHRSTFRSRFFDPAVKKAGLSPGLTFHGLRHSAVSILATEGASINEVARIMGWSPSTEAQMSARYSHLFPSRERQLTERLDARIRQAMEAADGR